MSDNRIDHPVNPVDVVMGILGFLILAYYLVKGVLAS